jgi:Lon protease-like protein
MLSFLKDIAERQPFTVPLFPLRTVLFPGGLLPLKLFEQRYIDMAKACLKDERPFGVCLITRGEEVAATGQGPPDFAAIGTLAQITAWDMPQLGILHIATAGGARIHVQKHIVEPSGLVMGEVTTIAVEPASPLPEAFGPLAKLLEVIAARVGAQNFPAGKRYDDASWVGYRLAELLPLPLTIKQTMLEINDPGVRLKVLQQFLVQQGLL